MSDITLAPATTDTDIAAVRSLCWAYRDFLLAVPGISRAVTSAFHPDTRYESLMASLPELHARPTGVILLARDATGTPAGCGMSHPLDRATSEIKRVFVTDIARGQGLAEQICSTLISQARSDGYSRVVLDTHRLLHSAQRLYRRMGFTERGPYQPIPPEALPELRFFEYPL